MLSFLNKYNDLYSFWTNVLLENTNDSKIISQQLNFLKDLMNGFDIYKNISKLKHEPDNKAGSLYLLLLENPN